MLLRAGPVGYQCAGKLHLPFRDSGNRFPLALTGALFAHQQPIAACAALHLAVLFPTLSSWRMGRASAGAISLAVADANEMFPVKMSYIWEEVACDATQATAAISRMLQDDKLDAVIGPDCEAACESSAYLTAGRNIVQISYSCASDLLSNKKKYPTVPPTHAHARMRAHTHAACPSARVSVCPPVTPQSNALVVAVGSTSHSAGPLESFPT